MCASLFHSTILNLYSELWSKVKIFMNTKKRAICTSISQGFIMKTDNLRSVHTSQRSSEEAQWWQLTEHKRVKMCTMYTPDLTSDL